MKYFFLLLLAIFCLSHAFSVKAAQLNLESLTAEVGVGQEFQVNLMLDADGSDVNAIEGAISFPKNLLELKEIRDGDSVISFWIKKPVLGVEKVIFSGVIPGGFSGVLSPYYKGGKPGKIFSLFFSAKSEGSGAVEIRGAKILLNDGRGTSAKTLISNFQFLISRNFSGSAFKASKDTDPPELFAPQAVSDPNVLGGKWFLIFSAQDKISGIDHYEAQETLSREPDKNNWQKVESPYVLKDQSRTSYIFVKAVDRAGNKRIVYISPSHAPWYKNWPVDIIVILGVIIVLLLIKWLWRKLKIAEFMRKYTRN